MPTEQVHVPDEITERVQDLCLALPEVTRRVDDPRTTTRSTAYSYDIRRGSFCLLVATSDRAGNAAPVLIVRAGPDERQALLSNGHPYFASRAGRDRLGVHLRRDTDWDEIRELVTESYRRLAPKKLIQRLDR